VSKGSQFRNDIGLQGAKSIAQFLMRNKTLECLDINDCNIGPQGGEAIGMALAQN
jgi:Ran GTPase-activating protein (RanGAP) involved in mRNA processing and transport